MEHLSQHVESLIFSSEQPISPKEIKNVLEYAHETKIKLKEIIQIVEDLKLRYEDDQFSFELTEIDGAYQFLSKPAYFDSVAAYLKHTTKKRLSKPALETLAIIAYKQPITKIEAEKIRGVSCDYAVQKLLEKELVEIIGRSEAPGRPLLYATTSKFMDYFGLKDISELPKLKDFNSTENTIGELAPIEETVTVDEESENGELSPGKDSIIDEIVNEDEPTGNQRDDTSSNNGNLGPNVEIVEHIDPEAFIIEPGLYENEQGTKEKHSEKPENEAEQPSESDPVKEDEQIEEPVQDNEPEGEPIVRNDGDVEVENEGNLESNPIVESVESSSTQPTGEPGSPESEENFEIIPNQRFGDEEE